jgi:hypothetical protein
LQQLKARTADGEFGLLLEPGPQIVMDRFCKQSGDIETGGILLGRYIDDGRTALILEATGPPPDSRTAHSWFLRGASGLHALLIARWMERTPSHYVGEWHYHPSTLVQPSVEDLAQMLRIANTESYSCKEPILVIWGMPDNAAKRPVRCFVFPRGEAWREMMLLERRPSSF